MESKKKKTLAMGIFELFLKAKLFYNLCKSIFTRQIALFVNLSK